MFSKGSEYCSFIELEWLLMICFCEVLCLISLPYYVNFIMAGITSHVFFVDSSWHTMGTLYIIGEQIMNKGLSVYLRLRMSFFCFY